MLSQRLLTAVTQTNLDLDDYRGRYKELCNLEDVVLKLLEKLKVICYKIVFIAIELRKLNCPVLLSSVHRGNHIKKKDKANENEKFSI